MSDAFGVGDWYRPAATARQRGEKKAESEDRKPSQMGLPIKNLAC